MQDSRIELQNIQPMNATPMLDGDDFVNIANIDTFAMLMQKDAKSLLDMRSSGARIPDYFDVKSVLPSNRLEEHVMPYVRDSNFKFSIAFPDGTKAHVTGENSPHMMVVNVNTTSKKLAENLRANKARTEKSLEAKMRKKVTLNLDD